MKSIPSMHPTIHDRLSTIVLHSNAQPWSVGDASIMGGFTRVFLGFDMTLPIVMSNVYLVSSSIDIMVYNRKGGSKKANPPPTK
jgi:hypothetical protein